MPEAQKVKPRRTIIEPIKVPTYASCLSGGQFRDPRAGFGRTKPTATQLNDAPGGKFNLKGLNFDNVGSQALGNVNQQLTDLERDKGLFC